MNPSTQGKTASLSPLPVVILISGNGSNLQAIIDATIEGTLPIEIEAVISDQKNAYGLTRATKAGILTEIVEKKDFVDRQSYDVYLQKTIEKYQPELIILAGFMRILGEEFVRHFSGKILNIHPSLLPKYPGLHTHQKVIDNKDTEHGISIHFVTEEVDAGPIILQSRFSVKPGESVESLEKRVHALEHLMYPLAIRWYCEGII